MWEPAVGFGLLVSGIGLSFCGIALYSRGIDVCFVGIKFSRMPILPSDWVLSYDEGGRLKPGRVVRLFDNITDEWVELSMENGAGDGRKLTATPGHVFLNEFGDHEQIQSMLQRGNGAAMLVNMDGSFVRASGEMVCFSHANAGEYEQAQGGVNAVEGGMALESQLHSVFRNFSQQLV